MARTPKVSADTATTTQAAPAKPVIKKQSLQEMVLKLKAMVDDDLQEFGLIANSTDIKNIHDIANKAVKVLNSFIDNFDSDAVKTSTVDEGFQTVILENPTSESYNKLMILKKVKEKRDLKLPVAKQICDLLFDGKPVALETDLIQDLTENDECTFTPTDEPSAYIPSDEDVMVDTQAATI